MTGLQSGDNITGILSTVAASGSPVGNYPITAGLSDPGGRLSNYSVTTNAGTLTVTPAPLVITPNNQSRSYGLPNPLLTGTVAGLQNGETSPPLLDHGRDRQFRRAIIRSPRAF